MKFNKIWNSNNESEWNELFKKYWDLVNVDNIQVEHELNRLSIDSIACMNKEKWYEFLYNKYFIWKYTAKNRLATTRAQLKKYNDSGLLGDLDIIRKKIISLDTEDIKGSLSIACEIKGLGIAGASGLLSLIYPKKFATVDQFVVKALLDVEEQKEKIVNMNPENLTINNGVTLTNIMREKSTIMNETFDTQFWTPRTLEMALWAYRG